MEPKNLTALETETTDARKTTRRLAPSAQKPSVGRIVIFNASTPSGPIEQRAALVVDVQDDATISVVAWCERGVQTTHRSVLMGDGVDQWQWPAWV